MQNVIISLLINGLMAALLLATMIYCRRLNTRIKVLQDSKSELARIISEFDESTQRATQSIADIHAATMRISDNIQHKIDKANFLADDLQYMIEKSQKIAGKTDVPSNRLNPNDPAPVSAAVPPASKPTATRPSTIGDALGFREERTLREPGDAAAASLQRTGRVRSRAEQEIMSALGAKKPPLGE